MAQWWQNNWIGFDTETTGVNPSLDALVSAAVVDFLPADGETDAKQWLADPGCEIPAQAAAVHGITTEYAQANGRPLHIVVEEIAQALTQKVQQGLPIVIYNATFDYTLLEAHLQRFGLPTLEQRLGFVPLIDPLVLDRHLDRYRRGSRKLADVAKHYGIQAGDDFHDALADVRYTLEILKAMVVRYPALQNLTLQELYDLQKQAYYDWAVSFNAWKESKGGRADTSTSWPQQK